MFEPRLSSVSVTAEPRNELDPTLKFRVEALLEIEPAPESITFDTVLEGDSGKFSVTGKNK
jgi:type VI secretion system protein ImpF